MGSLCFGGMNKRSGNRAAVSLWISSGPSSGGFTSVFSNSFRLGASKTHADKEV